MKIVIEQPPILEIAKAVFDIPKNAVFTYGDTLYNPQGGHVDEHLMRHEETHTRQQGIDPDGWWKRYVSDPEFRLSQEVEAYHNQYMSFCKTNKDRNNQTRFLMRLAKDLSSPMYKLGVSMHSSMQMIRSFE